MTNLSNYELKERIHEGRSHDVVRAVAPDGKTVVLKILRDMHPSPEQVARFKHEFQTLAASLRIGSSTPSVSRRISAGGRWYRAISVARR